LDLIALRIGGVAVANGGDCYPLYMARERRGDKQRGCRQALENQRLQSFDGRVVDLSRRIE
jgi:hypothetical protein